MILQFGFVVHQVKRLLLRAKYVTQDVSVAAHVKEFAPKTLLN